MADLEFRVLGSLEVRREGVPLHALGAAKQRVLLALLLVRANRVVSPDRLIEELWPGTRPATARNTLHSLVLRLRRALDRPGADGADAGELIRRGGGGYVLAVDPDRVDAFRFEKVVARGRGRMGDGDAEGAASSLREALALWRGPAFADVAEAVMVRAEADRLDDLRLAVVEECVEAELALGRHAEVVGELRVLVADHPLRERAWGQLMLALYRSGCQADALAAFRQVYHVLSQEQGVEPGIELRRLQQQILRGDPGLWDLGPRTVPRGPVTPRQLPPDAAFFIGRSEQLRTLDSVLLDADRPGSVCVISGAAGIGKTALAVHWARRVADRFPDGQIYLDLHGYAAAAPLGLAQALAHLLRSLNLEPEKIPVEVDLASGLYRSLLHDKAVLVLLDNAATPAQVRPLLPGAPHCRVLVTSRDRLGGLVARDGAVRLPLDVLSANEAAILVAEAVGADRAAAEPEQVTRLARLCGGVPLALRIAAARLADQPDRPIREYVEALAENRLAALEVVGDEQSAVRASFDLSYRALPPAERRLFRLLGLALEVDITADAAAALADTTPHRAARMMDMLANVSLVSERAPGRFALHDLLRLYAADLAATDLGEHDRIGAIRRLLDWYLDGARSAADLLYPRRLRFESGPLVTERRFPAEGAAAWMAAERRNLIAAVSHAADSGLHELAVRLAAALDPYLWAHGHLADCLSSGVAALRAAANLRDARASAVIRGNLGKACWTLGDYDKAIGHFRAALGYFRSAGDGAGEARMLINLGLVQEELGQLGPATDFSTRALAIYQDRDDLDGQAYALDFLACLYGEQGRLAEAARYDEQALAIARRIGDASNVINILGNLAFWTHQLGRPAEALQLLDEALAGQTGTVMNHASLLDTYAAIHRDTGRYELALGDARRCLRSTRESRLRRGETEALNTIASIQLARGAVDAALDLHTEALHVSREIGYRSGEAVALTGLAAALHHRGRLQDAAGHVELALAVARQSGHRLHQAHALTVLAAIQLGLGDIEASVQGSLDALSICRKAGYRLGEARALTALGYAMERRSDHDGAMCHWREAQATYAAIGAAPAPALTADGTPRQVSARLG